MGLRFERVPEEDQEIDLALSDARADLLVAAQRAAALLVDIQAALVGDDFALRVPDCLPNFNCAFLRGKFLMSN